MLFKIQILCTIPGETIFFHFIACMNFFFIRNEATRVHEPVLQRFNFFFFELIEYLELIIFSFEYIELVEYFEPINRISWPNNNIFSGIY